MGSMLPARRWRRSRLATAVLIGSAAFVCGGSAATGSTAATAPRQLYVSPSGSDLGPCTRAAPCSTLGRAYKAATPGSEILMEAGEYPRQQILRDPRKSSGDSAVVVKPSPNAVGRVIVNGLWLGEPTG